ncbi:MAG: DUF805 domain-containing protein [Verrucomicrobia bacterium]|nr:DUF805 domain-containing protein [Verrucomicrobiota bacterium]
MNPVTAYISAIKQCFNYRGTTSRLEYWMFLIATWIIGLIFMLGGFIIFFGVMYFLGEEGLNENNAIIACVLSVYGFLFLLFDLLCMMLPFVGVTVRRLNDIGLSPWLALLYLVPGVNTIIVIVFGCVPGQNSK